jgi:hypothetical protein
MHVAGNPAHPEAPHELANRVVRRQAPQIELYRQLRRTVNIRSDGFEKPRLKAKHQDMHIAGPAEGHGAAGGV